MIIEVTYLGEVHAPTKVMLVQAFDDYGWEKFPQKVYPVKDLVSDNLTIGIFRKAVERYAEEIDIRGEYTKAHLGSDKVVYVSGEQVFIGGGQ